MGTLDTDEIIKRFFCTEFKFNDAKMYFMIMHLRDTDFHMHHNDLTEYVYANYEQVKLVEDGNQNKMYWELNIDVMKELVSAVTKNPNSLHLGKYKSVIKDNEKEILDLPNKMQEHIKLALSQYKYFFKKTEELVKKADTLENDLKDSKTSLDSANAKLENSTSEFISILGIFSALIFGVFGGFDAFKTIFENMKETPISTTMVDGAELMIGLIVLVFLLIESISILSNRSFLACGCKSTSECTHTFYKRYPLFYLSLSIFLIVMIGGSLIHYTNVHGFLYSNKIVGTVLVFLGVLIITIILSKVLKEIGKRNKKVTH